MQIFVFVRTGTMGITDNGKLKIENCVRRVAASSLLHYYILHITSKKSLRFFVSRETSVKTNRQPSVKRTVCPFGCGV